MEQAQLDKILNKEKEHSYQLNHGLDNKIENENQYTLGNNQANQSENNDNINLSINSSTKYNAPKSSALRDLLDEIKSGNSRSPEHKQQEGNERVVINRKKINNVNSGKSVNIDTSYSRDIGKITNLKTYNTRNSDNLNRILNSGNFGDLKSEVNCLQSKIFELEQKIGN